MANPVLFLYSCSECANEYCTIAGTNGTCANCGGFKRKQKPITNSDRIRAMPDEGLALWIAGDVLNLKGGSLEMATGAWLRWLRQEV